MTDEKLDILLRKSLQNMETAPEFHPVGKKTHAHRRISGLAAMCACAVLCVGVYVATQDALPHKTSAPETAVMQTTTASVTYGAAMDKADGAVNDSIATEESVAEAAPTKPATGACGYPTFADLQAQKWMEENAPGQPFERIAESEKYCSYLCVPAEGERLYLVVEKETGEPVSLEKLLERNGFSGNREAVNMLYVNEAQELIRVNGTEEINLGYVE